MTEGDLARLRLQLLASFDEDIVQDTLVELLIQPVEPEVPLAWCRHAAAWRRRKLWRNERRWASVPIPPSLSTRPMQEQRLIAKEVLQHAHVELLRDAFGAPQRVRKQRCSEHRAQLRSQVEG